MQTKIYSLHTVQTDTSLNRPLGMRTPRPLPDPKSAGCGPGGGRGWLELPPARTWLAFEFRRPPDFNI